MTYLTQGRLLTTDLPDTGEIINQRPTWQGRLLTSDPPDTGGGGGGGGY